jgi:adenylate cyclase class IV
VEAKFIFTQLDEERIATDPLVKLIKKKSFTDTYFDSVGNGFPLTTKDVWLRLRDGKWQIKIPIGYYTNNTISFGKFRNDEGLPCPVSARTLNADSYIEIEVPRDIQEFLLDRQLIVVDSNASQESLGQTLLASGFQPVCELTTFRSTFQHADDVTIDLDRTIPMDYRVGELEVMVGSQGDAKQAMSRIEAVAKHHQLNIQNGMHGKVLEYLRVYSPAHYQALDECGLLDSKGIMKHRAPLGYDETRPKK